MESDGHDASNRDEPQQQDAAESRSSSTLPSSSQSAVASTSRAPFQSSPVPARFRRHLDPSNAPPPPPPRRRSSLRHDSFADSASSDGEQDEDDGFDGPSLNRFHFSRGYSNTFTSGNPGIIPNTPTTPLTPLTPLVHGLHRPGGSFVFGQRRKSGLSKEAILGAHLAQEPAATTTSEKETAVASTYTVETEVATTEEAQRVPLTPTSVPEEQGEEAKDALSQRRPSSASTTSSIPESRPSDFVNSVHSDLLSDSIHVETLREGAQTRPLLTQLRERRPKTSAPAQTMEQDPFADSNEAPTKPSLSPGESQRLNEADKDGDLEKGQLPIPGGKVGFDQSAFPDYAPLVQSRVTVGRWGLMLAIGALNMGLIILFLFLAPPSASLVVMIALKSRDILSVLWQSLLYIISLLTYPLGTKKQAVIHPPRKIVSLVPVYKESTQDLLDTVDSIIKDNPVRPEDFNMIAIMADGFDVEDDVIIQHTMLRVEDFPYFSWKIRESAFRLQFGLRMGLPIVIVRKVKNAGKKDSLIFAFDLFNSDNEATGHCNSEAREMVLDHIRKLYNQPDLQHFDFLFCTDADTKILAGSVNALADRLMDEGEETVGACGIVEADFDKPGRSWRSCGLWYFWDHFQGFQYTYGQWIRRRSESSWGRVTCMPGAITMLRTGCILGQASAEYRKHVANGNLINRQVQYQGTDRRLCWTIISRSKSVRTVLETRAACFTIPPQTLSHYLSQRRRWGSNAYFNAFVTMSQQNQLLVTRLWMSLELCRSTLVFFRMYNFCHFVYNLVTKFSIVAVAPLLAITMLPQIWFLVFVCVSTKRYRPLVVHLLYGAVLNRLCSIVLTPTVYANVLLGFGDFRWGKSHTGANAAQQAQAGQESGEDKEGEVDLEKADRGNQRPLTSPKDQTEIC
ncbi:hypothetical protein NDA10_000250 [Ustilago hordei]|nr:hypothetical protein NDA10_000250 [Ustilago hordei]KAJ1570459.1 hypothetical protein NDA15_006665 [Ustilago hordei]KAJ1571859.1 hypothetical protein NDA12_006227 [Ustilago hordei]UTT87964.1 hypothetical protein NDA17_002856 [Ustilago hordei]